MQPALEPNVFKKIVLSPTFLKKLKVLDLSRWLIVNDWMQKIP